MHRTSPSLLALALAGQLAACAHPGAGPAVSTEAPSAALVPAPLAPAASAPLPAAAPQVATAVPDAADEPVVGIFCQMVKKVAGGAKANTLADG